VLTGSDAEPLTVALMNWSHYWTRNPNSRQCRRQCCRHCCRQRRRHCCRQCCTQRRRQCCRQCCRQRRRQCSRQSPRHCSVQRCIAAPVRAPAGVSAAAAAASLVAGRTAHGLVDARRDPARTMSMPMSMPGRCPHVRCLAGATAERVLASAPVVGPLLPPTIERSSAPFRRALGHAAALPSAANTHQRTQPAGRRSIPQMGRERARRPAGYAIAVRPRPSARPSASPRAAGAGREGCAGRTARGAGDGSEAGASPPPGSGSCAGRAGSACSLARPRSLGDAADWAGLRGWPSRPWPAVCPSRTATRPRALSRAAARPSDGASTGAGPLVGATAHPITPEAATGWSPRTAPAGYSGAEGSPCSVAAEPLARPGLAARSSGRGRVGMSTITGSGVGSRS
jgi:hypothetical protein